MRQEAQAEGGVCTRIFFNIFFCEFELLLFVIRCHSRLGNHRKNEDFFITFFEILKGVRQHTLLITQAEGGVGRKMGACFKFVVLLYH